MTDPLQLHRDAVVIDMTCPLARDTPYVTWWREGEATAIAPTITGMSGDARTGFSQIGSWHRYVRERDDTLIVYQVADIERAQREGKLGLILHCQGTALIEDELDLVDSYYAAGLRVVQLCYNRKNLVGDGASERTNAGLSHFGIKLVERLNALGMAVDCAHTGERTSLDAVEFSSAPVIISHANARGLHDNRRNISDDLIKAIAASGGVVGTVGFPAFLAPTGQPTLDRFIDDITYKSELVGIDHVGLGIDYYQGQHPVEDETAARARYDKLIADGQWRSDDYPPPPYKYPEGIETPATLQTLTVRLLERGFAELDVRKILGLNWMRVFRDIWGG
jgi:membrane dipeptidase